MRIKSKNIFLGRQEYIETIKRFYNKPGSSFTIMKGRRRVGKSEILKHYRDQNSDNVFLFTGDDKKNTKALMKQFVIQWSKFTKDETLLKLNPAFYTWNSLLEEVFDWMNRQDSAPYLLILDEIQWLSKKHSGFAGSLKNSYEAKKNNGKIKIIICGSSVKFFQNNKDNTERALMGLSSFASIDVQPFTLKEVKQFYFPKWTNEEVALTYMMLGGIPYYLDELDPERPFRVAINEAIFTKDTIFLGLIDELVNLEFNKVGVENVKKILKVIRHEGATESKIVKETGFSQQSVHEYLQSLCAYNLCKPKNKLGKEVHKNSSGVVYNIKYFFINFFFKYFF